MPCLWSIHRVHHDIEHLNLSTGMRISAFQRCFSFPFYLPLARGGVPFETTFLALSFNAFYQLCQHTHYVAFPRWTEWVLNSPRVHRVHHGRDRRYSGSNLAGMFVLWDHLFGTFRREEGPLELGVEEPVGSSNPHWINVDALARPLLARRSRRSQRPLGVREVI